MSNDKLSHVPKEEEKEKYPTVELELSTAFEAGSAGFVRQISHSSGLW